MQFYAEKDDICTKGDNEIITKRDIYWSAGVLGDEHWYIIGSEGWADIQLLTISTLRSRKYIQM